jgi:hypothetical protein
MDASAPLIEWLHAATDRINLIDLPVRRMLSVDGLGEPRGIVFTESAEALREVMHQIARRHPSPTHERQTSAHLEAIWWVGAPGEPPHFAYVDLAAGPARLDRARASHPDLALRWRLMLELPGNVADDEARTVTERARTERHDRLGIDRIEITQLAEGRCAQILHVGAFADESPTLDRLESGVTSEGYELVGPHHEVFLSDIRLSDPSRWRRIIRYPVRRIEGYATIGAPAEIPVSTD